jgi:hypothetical protein
MKGITPLRLKWVATLSGSIAVLMLCAGCASFSRHQFVEPSLEWQARSGQLLYRAPKTTLIGEVLVRFSKTGEFELTFSKGPSVPLLTVRQDANFAEVRGALVRGGWSGPAASAPAKLRGWLSLRDRLLHSPQQSSIRHVAGAETFIFRF